MGIFLDDELDNDNSISNSLARSMMYEDVDDDYLEEVRENTGTNKKPNDSMFMTKKEMAYDAAMSALELSAGTPYFTGVMENPLDLIGGYPEVDSEVWGNPDLVSALRNGDTAELRKARNTAAYEAAKLTRGEDNLKDNIARWFHRNDEALTPEQATEYARSMGSDLKFDKPHNLYEIERAIYTNKLRKVYEQSLADIQSYNPEALQDAKSMITLAGSQMRGAVGPIELAATIGLGWLIPNMAVAVTARTAGVALNGALRYKKVSDAVAMANRIKNMDRVYTALATGSKVGNQEILSVFGKTLTQAEMASMIASSKKELDVMLKLENISKLNYANLSTMGKIAPDAAGIMAIDQRFIDAKLEHSKELELGIYTEKDKAVETLLAFGLGAGGSAVVRGVAEKTGIGGRLLHDPAPIKSREIDEARRAANAKRAAGELSDEEFETISKDLDERQASIDKVRGNVKSQPKALQEQAETLEMTNMTDKEIITAIAYVDSEMSKGNIPNLLEVPHNTAIMSRVDARVLRPLLSSSAQDVFANKVHIDTVPSGITNMVVRGEEGLLGQVPIHAISEDEAYRRLGLMYRGFILKDSEALNAFKDLAISDAEFAKDLRAVITLYDNITKGGAEAPATFNKERAIREAYLKYRLGPEYANYEEQVKLNEFLKATGENPEAFADDIESVLKDSDDFVDKWLSKSESKSGEYVFVNPETGKSDYGKSFRAFVSELEDAMADNAHLASIDDILNEVDKQNLLKLKGKGQGIDNIVKFDGTENKFDTSLDTNIYELFGSPRVKFDAFSDAVADLRDTKIRVDNSRLAYESMLRDPEYDGMLKAIRSAGRGSDSTEQRLIAKALDKIESIRELSMNDLFDKKEGIPLEQKIVNVLKENDKIQQAIFILYQHRRYYDPAKYKTTSDMPHNKSYRHFKRVMRTAMKSVIDDILDTNMFTPRQAGKITDDALHAIFKAIDNDASLLSGFMDEKHLSTIYKIGNDKKALPSQQGVNEKLVQTNQTTAKAVVDMSTLMQPLRTALETSLYDIELQEMHNVAITLNKINQMMKMPAYAAEAITGSATQTIVDYKGAANSVEYMSKSSSYYMHDLYNRLERGLTVDGKETRDMDLLNYLFDESNGQSITEAAIRMKHGEALQENTKDVMIARILGDQTESFLTNFRQMGSKYSANKIMNFIDRSKLKYADTAIDDVELSDIYTAINEAASSLDDYRAVAESLVSIGPDGPRVRYGSNFISPEESVGYIKTWTDAIKRDVSALQNLESDAQSKLAGWALRDFDMSEMWDVSMRSELDLNLVRDALLSGDFRTLLDSNLGTIKAISEAVSIIRNSLIGPSKGVPIDSATGKIIPIKGWVLHFQGGFDSVAAGVSNRRAPALTSMTDNLIFKNADAEIAAAAKFGYDNVEQMVEHSYDKMFDAYYALREFGTQPETIAMEWVDIYNNMINHNPDFLATLTKMGKDRGLTGNALRKFIEKCKISEGAKNSVRENILIATGMANSAPSAPMRWMKMLTRMFGSAMLLGAGMKSFADVGTIMSHMIMNGLSSKPGNAFMDVMTAFGRAFKYSDDDVRRYLLGAKMIEAETVFRKLTNDPAVDIIKLSSQASTLDKVESGMKWYSNMLLNGLGRMQWATGKTKDTAAWAISRALGKMKDTSYGALNAKLQKMLLRHGFEEADWDFIRKHMIVDAISIINERTGKNLKGSDYIFNVMNAFNLKDDVWSAEMAKRGIKNINRETVAEFKNDILSKAWAMVDSGAEEMISIPSGRIQNWMRFGKSSSSSGGILAEIVTQFQSFPATMAYNNYFRYFAKFADHGTGITAIDIFNPFSKAVRASDRFKAYMGFIPILASVGLANTAVDIGVGATQGRIQSPWDEKNGFHGDMLRSSMLNALGLIGILLNGLWEAVEGSGQRGGGVSLQVAPAASNVTRILYRESLPLRRKKYDSMEDRIKALGAGAVQTAAQFTGISSAPFISLGWQALFGSYLDMIYQGGPQNYNRYLEQRKKRGYVVFPWQERY